MRPCSTEAVTFHGPNGNDIRIEPIPAHMQELADTKRHELVEAVAEADDELGELFLMGEMPTVEQLKAAIRRTTIARTFAPFFMGSAFKNKGVQLLLDGVVDYLPAPHERENGALDLNKGEEQITLKADPKAALVSLAFKLQEGKYGQLTYMRIYQGTISKGDTIVNTSNGKKLKVPRLVRMHSDEMEDVSKAECGEIVALFGVDCKSGDTFTDGTNIAMNSMHIPEPVMSLAVTPKSRAEATNFSKALQRFQREDPTFKVHNDEESGQTIISGMGELHLDIYVERMKREYKVEVDAGEPRVNYRECITARANFDYLHKKQSGGSGQYGRVIGYVEPLEEGDSSVVFENSIIGASLTPGFIQACEKGFKEGAQTGGLIGHPVEGMRIVLTDGASHAVDSNEMAFKIAALNAFRQVYEKAAPKILEPVMSVQITVPTEFQGGVIGNINRRKGTVKDSTEEGDDAIITCDVPLKNMFGYSTELRSMTQGKGEFTMEYASHAHVTQDVQTELCAEYGRTRKQAST